ncbi:MAG: DUF362 domain-containing protein [candidate division NC10 bacterium]|nr:DUF362 domain-containing protein [candidate division NC10 bacterium]
MHRLTRRELLKAGVATVVLARFARAAVSPVYLLRTTDRAEGIRRGLAALGFPPARGKRVVIKTHRYGGHFTLSLKNSVGMVAKDSPSDNYNYMSELHGSAYQRQMIAEINQLYQPAMVVMDGLEAFTDGGPESGTLVTPQVMVFGTDRVAVDAVGVAILRMHGGNATISRGRIFEQEQIARAAQLGLGARGPEQIDLVADDPESRQLAERIRQILRRG